MGENRRKRREILVPAQRKVFQFLTACQFFSAVFITDVSLAKQMYSAL